MTDIVKIFDTTLRDGEQSPGCSMNLEEKLRVAAQLEAMGYPVARSYQSFAFGAPHGVKVDGAGWSGGSDPQRDGMAIAV